MIIGGKMKKKEDLRILKTKASLYRGLMNLMKKKPFEEINVSEICKESLINRSTFYDHYSDKYELIESLMNDMRKELGEKIDRDKKTSNLKEYYIEVMKKLDKDGVKEPLKTDFSKLQKN